MVDYDKVSFNFNLLGKYELLKSAGAYFPLVINVNYSKDGKQYAFMNYGEFTKNSSTGLINGVRITKQLVMV